MADASLKTSNPAARFPKPNDSESTGSAVIELLKQAPLAGDATAHILSVFFSPLQRRQEAWFKELAADLDEMQAAEASIVDKLTQNDAFISALVQATRAASGTHSSEKRQLLRNALMNIALDRAPNEELQQVFLNAIDQLSVSHVRVLDFVWKGFQRNNNPWQANDFPTSSRDYGAAIRIALPEFAGEDNLLLYILTDLRNRGFSNLSGPNAPYPQGMPATITNMGIRFLDFVRRSQ